MSDWLEDVRRLAGREPVAMIGVLATEGSAPRGPGTRMLVTAAATFGTIGGGQIEYRAVDQARAILAHPAGTWRVQDYPLGPLLGQCCGGRVRVLVEHVDPTGFDWSAATDGARLVTSLAAGRVERALSDTAGQTTLSARGPLLSAGDRWVEVVGQRRRPVYLFGGGHVGQAIARHASGLPLRLAWFDTRPEYDAMDGLTVVAEDAVADCIADAPHDAAIVILTHDHGLDYTLTRAALRRSPVAFVGLIGSATKRARFLSKLERDGVDTATRARLTCPIGVEGIDGKEPDVIAVATLAQLLQLGVPA